MASILETLQSLLLGAPQPPANITGPEYIPSQYIQQPRTTGEIRQPSWKDWFANAPAQFMGVDYGDPSKTNLLMALAQAVLPIPGKAASGPLTKVMAGGKPKQVYHGTGTVFDDFKPTWLDNEALYGPGIYFTEDAATASGYALKRPNPPYPSNEQLAEYFKPGRLVPSYGGGYDEVLEFKPTDAKSGWHVKVQAVDPKTGKRDSQYPVPRIHATVPEALTKPQPQPNVRPAFLDITNPFDIDSEHDGATLATKIRMIANALPPERSAGLHGIANDLAGMGRVSGAAVYQNLARQLDKDGANDLLARVGFDGITHIGGARTGNQSHRVWIAFKPEQVVNPYQYLQSISPSILSGAGGR